MEHKPECACYPDTCCSWIEACDCQCLCDLIIKVEERVRNDKPR